MLQILLALYNGSKYLPEFLESLDAQTNQQWMLSARDDGSKDATVRIVAEYCAKRGPGNKLVPGNNVGVIRNFSLLLENSDADYIMLADQDDVWYPSKIATSLAAIQKLESENGGVDVPALVFTDLHVVDADLKLIDRSFVRSQGLLPLALPSPVFRKLLTQNAAPGCTMIVNRALLRRALPVPSSAVMHDWWLIQVAALLGVVGFVDEPTIAYRQHGSNQVGATSLSVRSVLRDLLHGGKRYKGRIRDAQGQAAALLEHHGGRMSVHNAAAVKAFATLSEHRFLARQWIAYRHRLSKAGATRNIGFYVLM